MGRLGKWRQIRLKNTDILRAGERPYYIGIVLEGRVDVLHEIGATDHKWHSCIQENELIFASDFQTNALKSKYTFKVRSDGATLFLWETQLLKRMMTSDPRLNT